MGVLIAFLAVVALLVFMGLGNNNRLPGSLQPKYTETMDSLQEKQDEKTRQRALLTEEERKTRNQNRQFAAFLLIVVLVGFARACGF